MCLVEEDKSLKLIVACATLILTNEIQIYTNTNRVKRARESILEFLLINHPLDCPICDQGGECDLQDQTLVFGSDRGRFYEYKRAVPNKNLGQFVKTSMNRCIHCTRCVRFINEISNKNDIGLLGRGNSAEIGTYITNSNIDNELFTNIVDLCPVGALTIKPAAFKYRSWKLENYETTDIYDPLLPTIRVDIQENKLIRVLPKVNKYLNEDWLTDRTRFMLNSRKNGNSINYPQIQLKYGVSKEFSKIIGVSWYTAFGYFKIRLINLLRYQNLVKIGYLNFLTLFGNGSDLITCYSFRLLLTLLGSVNIYYNKGYTVNKLNSNNDFQDYYLLNSFTNLLNLNKSTILIGDINLRIIVPLLNLKLNQLVKKNKLNNLFYFGKNFNNNLSLTNIGNSWYTLIKLISGKTWINQFFFYDNTFFFFNHNLVQNNSNFLQLFNILRVDKVFKQINISYNFINISSTLINLYELNLINSIHSFQDLPKKNNFKSFIGYFINTKTTPLIENLTTKNLFTISQKYSYSMTDLTTIFFPNRDFLEQTTLHFNIEGKLQNIYPIKIGINAKSRGDWEILILLLTYFNIIKIKFNQFINIKQRLLNNLIFYIPSLKKDNNSIRLTKWILHWSSNKINKSYYDNNFIKNYICNYNQLFDKYNKTLSINKKSNNSYNYNFF